MTGTEGGEEDGGDGSEVVDEEVEEDESETGEAEDVGGLGEGDDVEGVGEAEDAEDVGGLGEAEDVDGVTSGWTVCSRGLSTGSGGVGVAGLEESEDEGVGNRVE